MEFIIWGCVVKGMGRGGECDGIIVISGELGILDNLRLGLDDRTLFCLDRLVMMFRGVSDN